MTSSYFRRAGVFANGHWMLWLSGGFIVLMLALKAADVLAGSLPDNDDMLRLQQVRDLLAGQAWLNVDQARFLTPEGGDIHWSRLPDLFLAGVIVLTRPLLGQANAEALAMIMWPLIVLIWTLAAMVTAMRRLGLGLAGQVSGLVFFGMSAAVSNFWPGRIDHHGLVVALTLTGFAAALSPSIRAQSGLIAAACIAAMISVAIESLPYAGILVLAFGLYWIVRGHQEGVRLTVFGLALAMFAALFYVGDAPGIGPRRAVCDAYGNAHFAGLASGGVLLALLGMFGGWFETWAKRLMVGALAGVAVLAVMIWVQPGCLGDPYAEVSDQARLAWLSAVGEARSLPRLWSEDPAQAVWQYGFIVSGLIAAGLLLWRAPNGQHAGRAVLGLFLIVAALATVWQIRGVTFSHVFAAIAGGWLVGVLFDNWWEKRGTGPVLALALGAFAVAPMSWNMVSQIFARPIPTNGATAIISDHCHDPEPYAALANHDPMKAFTPIDLGMAVLSRTPHSVFAGPYHRNVQGIEAVTDVFMGHPDAAQAKIVAIGADHVVYCRGLPETARYAKLRPESFAAEMEAGRVPDWLVATDDRHDTIGMARVYVVVGK